MKKEMFVSSSEHETRVAILEDDQVTELFIEREKSRGVVGNVYKGRVSKVLPGMQSAFVNLGLERDGFLYVGDVLSPQDDDLDTAGDEDENRSEAAGQGEQSAGNGRQDRRRGPERGSEQKIQELLKEGQEILVQVVKEPLGTKGARITSHVSIPGRFLVFMPTVDHVGVSRKIESREERSRLRGIVRRFRQESGFTGGVIIRTAASGRSEEDILGDLRYFQDVWTDVRRRMDTARANRACWPSCSATC